MSTTPTARFERPLVLGAGPVGRAIVDALVARGHRPTVVTRSGTAVHGAEARPADLTDPAAATAALADATIVFSTAQPAYHRWVEEFPALQASIVRAAQAAGAPLMVVENLYGYGAHDGPLTEDLPMRPTTRKGTVRAEMWRSLDEASARGELEMAVVRASDFVGPGIEGSAFGTRFFDPLHRGKPAQTIGDVDALHSVTFVPDLAEALVRVAEDDTSWGRAWHAPCAPAVSQRRLAGIAAASIGRTGSIRSTPVWMLRGLGVFVKPVGEMVEMLYEFDRDFVVDSSAFTGHFVMEATPLDQALAVVMGAEAVAA
ncbi:MAG TPA: NAD-dependent epimerase/dehydratase family protein [Ilumatobacteraceae bacterium]|nr:NAD-dependent epimerase/dehydratase family protein [Ilumatobacteraceae bacterium]